MAHWKLLSDEEAQVSWDAMLTRFDDCSPFQSYAWGEYRRALGWQPRRWIAYDEQNVPVAMMQGYLRRYPLGVGLVGSEGGPVGDLSLCDADFQETVRTTAGFRHVYYRFRYD